MAQTMQCNAGMASDEASGIPLQTIHPSPPQLTVFKMEVKSTRGRAVASRSCASVSSAARIMRIGAAADSGAAMAMGCSGPRWRCQTGTKLACRGCSCSLGEAAELWDCNPQRRMIQGGDQLRPVCNVQGSVKRPRRRQTLTHTRKSAMHLMHFDYTRQAEHKPRAP